MEPVRQPGHVLPARPVARSDARGQEAEQARERDGQRGFRGDAGPAGGQWDDQQADGPDGEQTDQARPDRVEPRGERLQEAQERALERSGRLCGDDTGQRQERGDESGDVGGPSHAGLIARSRIEPAAAAQQPAQVDGPLLFGDRGHATPRV